MEETIGYEALFSSEEWDSLDIVDWEPDGEGPDGPDADAVHATAVYKVEGGFEVECELCGSIGIAGAEDEAAAIATLHTSFVATLVEKFEVTR